MVTFTDVYASGLIGLFGLVVLSDEDRRAAANRIREALRLADIGLRKAALYMNLDHADLQRALSGERKLDFWRLQMLPRIFHQHLNILTLRDIGLPDYARAAVDAAAVVDERKSA